MFSRTESLMEVWCVVIDCMLKYPPHNSQLTTQCEKPAGTIQKQIIMMSFSTPRTDSGVAHTPIVMSERDIDCINWMILPLLGSHTVDIHQLCIFLSFCGISSPFKNSQVQRQTSCVHLIGYQCWSHTFSMSVSVSSTLRIFSICIRSLSFVLIHYRSPLHRSNYCY